MEVSEEQKKQKERLNFMSAISSGTVEEVSSFISSGKYGRALTLVYIIFVGVVLQLKLYYLTVSVYLL